MSQEDGQKRGTRSGVFEGIQLSPNTVLPLILVDGMDEAQSKYKPLDIIVDGVDFGDSADVYTTYTKLKEKMHPPRAGPRKLSLSLRDAPTARSGWAREALNENTPYNLLSRHDLFERCTYIMDHEDYVWCSANNVAGDFFINVVTWLERCFAIDLLDSAGGAEAGVSYNTAAASIIPSSNANDRMSKNHNDYQMQRRELVGNTIVCGVCAVKEVVDEGDLFLRCKRCSAQAHVRCWFLDHLPSNVDEWQCPSCTVIRRVGAIGRCHSCGRRGGVMLPFLSRSDWNQQCRVKVVSVFCHIVCCLTFEELSIDVQQRVVHQVKRAKKSTGMNQCFFCRSNCAGVRVRCHYPRCFVSMHPSCAQEAGMLECYRLPKGTTKEKWWAGCHVYCREHFGMSVSTDSGSSLKGNLAEAYALRSLTLSKCLRNSWKTRRCEDIQETTSQRQSTAMPSASVLEAVKLYWVKKRQKRLEEGAKIVTEINEGQCDVFSVLFRPEIMKISPTKVRLSRFVCLIPELQHHVNAAVEGLLPIPDEEYDEVQEYRKIHSRSRHAGNTPKLYEKMQGVASHVELFCELADLLHQRAVARRELLETELEILDAECFGCSGHQ